jgi:hypothetical protein
VGGVLVHFGWLVFYPFFGRKEHVGLGRATPFHQPPLTSLFYFIFLNENLLSIFFLFNIKYKIIIIIIILAIQFGGK